MVRLLDDKVTERPFLTPMPLSTCRVVWEDAGVASNRGVKTTDIEMPFLFPLLSSIELVPAKNAPKVFLFFFSLFFFADNYYETEILLLKQPN